MPIFTIHRERLQNSESLLDFESPDANSISSAGNHFIHSLSAWACDKGITLAHRFGSVKSTEITAIVERVGDYATP